MTKKHERKHAILRLVGSHAVASQEELQAAPRQRRMDVTQATLSRDLRDLGRRCGLRPTTAPATSFRRCSAR